MGDMLVDAGASRSEFSLADGSGLSVYNRLTPSAMTDLLVWASRQSWFDTWYSFLSQAGVDGTLKYRFTELGRDDRFRAKTGSLTGTGSLAGYFTARDGKRYAFAVFANDSSLRSNFSRMSLSGSIDWRQLATMLKRYSSQVSYLPRIYWTPKSIISARTASSTSASLLM